MKKILFYYGPNFKTVALETLIAEVKKRGYAIEVLTLSEKGDFHNRLTALDVKWTVYPFARSYSITYYIKQLWFLYKFCKKNDFDVIWSHLHPCNLAASIVQFFIRARVVIFRHHFHAIIKQLGLVSISRNERFMEWIICKLAREIVVPSSEVYNGMVQYENVEPAKIQIIPYIYNFDEYQLPLTSKIEALRSEYSCQLLVIMVSRLIAMKRHNLVFPIYKKLIAEGYDIKVLVMDNGEEKIKLQDYVRQEHLEDRIFFKGFVTNVLDYMAVSDIMVHPSFTDASSSALKEMGILGKPVIVCQGVGDVDEYILHDKNGWIITNDDEALQFETCIKDAYKHPEKIKQLGQALKETVYRKFSNTEATFSKYESKIQN